MFQSFLPHVLEIVQPDYTRRDSQRPRNHTHSFKDSSFFLKICLWLRRVIFHCHSHVFEHLGHRTIPSDRAAVGLAIQKPTHRRDQSKRISSWLSQHSVFCSLSQQRHDDHRFSQDPFCTLAEFQVLLSKAKRLTSRELSRETPACIGAKLLIACTAFACL